MEGHSSYSNTDICIKGFLQQTPCHRTGKSPNIKNEGDRERRVEIPTAVKTKNKKS